MVDFWNRMMRRDRPPSEPPEPLSRQHIDAGYRLFWTKMALGWEPERRAIIAARVAAITQSPEFEDNALERRFRVEGLDELAHSGASLLALADVLHALDAYEADHGE